MPSNDDPDDIDIQYPAELVNAVYAAQKARIVTLTKRIRNLETIIKADNERLQIAGNRVHLYYGCDTAESMADKIETIEIELKRYQAAAQSEQKGVLDEWIARANAAESERDALRKALEAYRNEHDFCTPGSVNGGECDCRSCNQARAALKVKNA